MRISTLNPRRCLIACLATATIAVLVLGAVWLTQSDSAAESPAKLATQGLLAKTTSAKFCPHALDPGDRAPEGVVRALRAAVPTTWHYTTPDGPLKLSAKNTTVLDLRSLGSDLPNVPRISSYYGKLAQRKCGIDVAYKTWVAVVYFPQSQAANYAQAFAFFARTRSGWKLWYHD